MGDINSGQVSYRELRKPYFSSTNFVSDIDKFSLLFSGISTTTTVTSDKFMQAIFVQKLVEKNQSVCETDMHLTIFSSKTFFQNHRLAFETAIRSYIDISKAIKRIWEWWYEKEVKRTLETYAKHIHFAIRYEPQVSQKPQRKEQVNINKYQ